MGRQKSKIKLNWSIFCMAAHLKNFTIRYYRVINEDVSDAKSEFNRIKMSDAAYKIQESAGGVPRRAKF
jgi:hypothetical protein